MSDSYNDISRLMSCYLQAFPWRRLNFYGCYLPDSSDFSDLLFRNYDPFRNFGDREIFLFATVQMQLSPLLLYVGFTVLYR